MDTRNKIILKNTIFLYVRMFFIMCLNLIAVRWLLQALGSTDYGINNVVGGVVAMMSFFTATMSSAAQRFYSYEIGINNQNGLTTVFNTIACVFVGISIVIIIFCEFFGPWIINSYLTIPEKRLFAAHVVFQASLLSFLINMMVVPMMALIIASEKMGFYSVISITDAVLKTIIILFVAHSNTDKLIMYAILLVLIAIVNLLAYFIYCKFLFPFIRIFVKIERTVLKELGEYCSWYLLGSFSAVIRSQGVNILLSVFFLPAVNAARAIAYQVNNAVGLFVSSFYQAVRPQIVKRYAANEMDSMLALLISSTKLSFYLVIIIAAPILVLAPNVLSLWLQDVPPYTALFTRLVLIITVVETLGHPLTTAICADGNIKRYQIATGGLTLLNLPLSYIALKMGAAPDFTMVVAIVITFITFAVRIYFAKQTVYLDVKGYVKMIFQLTIITLLIVSGQLLIICSGTFILATWMQMFLCLIAMLIYGIGIIIIVGLTDNEKKLLLSFFKVKKKDD